jgi:hypothetical protein
MTSSTTSRLAEIAKRMQMTPGVHVAPLVPSYKSDPVAWIRDKKPKIDSKGFGGIIPFVLWPYQRDIVRYLWGGGTYFIKKDRQMGFTTTLLAGAVPHKLLYGMEVQGVPCHFHILADTGDKALDLLRMTKVALYTAQLDNEERELLRGIDPLKAAKTIRYGLHSYVRCHATTGRSVRGYSGNGVLVEEAAFIEDLPDVWKAVSAMVSGLEVMPVQPSVWLVSSPNGPSYHEELCENAEQWNAKYIPYDFSQVPGRDAAWEAAERARLGDDIFEEEHGLLVVDSDAPLFDENSVRMHGATATPIPGVPQPGRRYQKGLDVSGSAGTTVFLVTDVTDRPAQVAYVEIVRGSFEEKRKRIVELDRRWPGPLFADGTWDPSFVGSLNGQVARLMAIRFTGGNVIGKSHDAQEQLRWTQYPRRKLQSGAKKLLERGVVVIHEERDDKHWRGKVWKAVLSARAHGKGETPGRVKNRGRFPDVLDALMLSLIPLMPRRAEGDDADRGRRAVPVPSNRDTGRKKW